MTTYLSVAEIIEINADQEGLVGVADLSGIEAAAHRPQSGAFGHEVFPDIWSKAAAYLHGFATTQYFTDANKRTAWLSATTFLALNGRRLPQVPAIEAEVFVRAVAQDVFHTDEDPDGTLSKAAEWFRVKWESQVPGAACGPRLGYAVLAGGASPAGDGQSLNIAQGGIRVINVSRTGTLPFPREVPFSVVGSFHWRPEDADEQRITATCVPSAPMPRINRPSAQIVMRKEAGFGLLAEPRAFQIDMRPIFLEPGSCHVTVALGAEILAQLPLTITNMGGGLATLFGTPDLPRWPAGLPTLMLPRMLGSLPNPLELWRRFPGWGEGDPPTE